MSDRLLALVVTLSLVVAALLWVPFLHLCRRCARRLSRRMLPMLLLPVAVGMASRAVAQVPVTFPAPAYSPASPYISDTVTVTLSVAGKSGQAAPTGTITYSIDTGSASTATLADNGQSGVPTNVAYLKIPPQTPGSHTLNYTYGGDSVYVGSARQTANFTVLDRPFALNSSQYTESAYVDHIVNGTISSNFGIGGVAVDAQGNEYLAYGATGSGVAPSVQKIDAHLTSQTTLSIAGLGHDVQMASDGSTLYLADPENNRVVVYTAAGVQSNLPITLSTTRPASISYEAASSSLLILDTGTNSVLRYSLATQTQTVVFSGKGTLAAAFAPDGKGNVYVVLNGQVGLYTAASGLFTPIFEELSGNGSTPSGLAYNPGTSELWLSYSYGGGEELVKFDASHHVSFVGGDSRKGQIALDAYGVLYAGGSIITPGPIANGGPAFGYCGEAYPGAVNVQIYVSVPYGRKLGNTPSYPGVLGSETPDVLTDFYPGLGRFNWWRTETLDNNATLQIPFTGVGFGPCPATGQGVVASLSSALGNIAAVAYRFPSATGNYAAYGVDSANNSVSVVDFFWSNGLGLNGGIGVSITSTKTLGFTGLKQPSQIFVDGAGQVYLLDKGDTGGGNRIVFLDVNGNQSTLYAASTGDPLGQIKSLTAFTVDGLGNLYLGGSTATGATIERVDRYGNGVIVGAPAAAPAALAIDGFHDVYSVDTATGALVEFVPGGTPKNFTTKLSGATSLSIDASGTLYATQTGASTVIAVAPDGTTRSIAVAGVANPTAVVVDFFGDLYVADGKTQQLFTKYFQQSNLSFGTVAPNSTATVTDTITNVGNLPLAPADAPVVAGPFTAASGATNGCVFSSAASPTSLNPAQSCSLQFQYAPTKTGTNSAVSLLISRNNSYNNITNSYSSQFNLAGTSANSTGSLSISPTSLTFGPTAQGSVSAAQTATITNTTSQAIYLSSGSLTDATDFTQKDNCNGLIAANTGTCTVTFTFTPQSTNALSSTYSIHDLNNPNSPLNVALNGIATGPPATLTVTPNPVAFPSTTVNTTSANIVVTLKNTGGSGLQLQTTIATLAGADPTAFSLIGSACGYTLVPNATCTLTLAFSPTAARTYNATLNIPSNDPNSPAVIPLTGTGVAAAVPQAAISPTSLTFTTVVNTAAYNQTVTLSNSGTGTLNIASVAIGGTNASSFSVVTSTCGATLTAGSSCTITVGFPIIVAGTYTATLTVTDNASSTTQTVALTGIVTGTAQAALTPASYSFGSVTTGAASASQSFTLSNAGTATLAITSIGLTGTNAGSFGIASNSCGASLAAGSTCSVAVSFAPASAGSFNASLSVVDALGTQSAALSGTGVSPTPADFTLVATPAAQSSYLGTSVNYSLALAPVSSANPYSAAINLSVSGLPSGATAKFAPASVTPGAEAVGSVLTVIVPALVGNNRSGPDRRGGGAPVIVSATLLLALFLTGNRRLRSRLAATRALLLLLLMVGISATLTGCGSGNGFAVPQSTSTITITGTSGTLVHTTTVTLTLK